MGTLIALGGQLRAGKDEVAQHLANKHGYVVMGMSDNLNQALLALNPWINTAMAYPEVQRYREYHDAIGYVEAKKNPEVRRLLQVLGTEVGRNMISQDVWVNMAERTIREHWAQNKKVVITAVRFPNEIEMVRRLGGTTVWIERASEARTDAQGDILAHASENSVSADDFEHFLDNDSTLDELFLKVDEALQILEVLKSKHQGYWANLIQADRILPGILPSEAINTYNGGVTNYVINNWKDVGRTEK